MPKLTNKQILSVLGIICVIILVVGYYIYTIINQNEYEEVEIEEVVAKNIVEENVIEEEIIIHIAGEVNKEGIVKIKEGARIADVIEAAGGLTEKANIKNVNLAYIVEDGQKIVIPSIDIQSIENNTITEYITKENGENIIQDDNKKETNTKLNINKASKDELTKLSGIGDATADKIIEYRNTNGEFKSIEDIKNVPGIGDAKFNNIKDYIEAE